MTDRSGMPRWAILAVGLVLVLLAGPARAAPSTCRVKYVSAEHVYLDAGRDQGLEAGATVRVVREGKTVAELEVVYVAANSATARMIAGSGVEGASPMAVGDTVAFTPPAGFVPPPDRPSEEPSEEPQAPARTRTVAGAGARPAAKPGLDVRGAVAVQWDHATDDSDRGLEADLLSMPFRLRADGLGGGVSFRARGSFRRIDRRGYPGSLPDREWRNRIREAGLVREGRDLAWHFAAGRIGLRETAAAGPFDGLSVSRRVGSGVRLGVFAGFAPAWEDLGFGTDDRLAGVACHLNHRAAGGNLLDLVVAGVGRYHRGEISREYLTMTTTWRGGRRWSLLQGAEVDLNRGWRRDAAGESLTLTGLALTGRYRATEALDLHLGYDDRKPVRTWESAALPDELFRDAGRLGWRAGLRWRQGRRLTLDLAGSTRRDDRLGQDSRSWNAGVSLAGLPSPDWNLDLSYRGFDGPYLSGWAPAAGLYGRILRGLRVRLEGGYFGYDGVHANSTRSSAWAGLGLSRDLGRFWTAAASYRRDWGDDIEGGRLFLELGLRF